MCLAIIVRLFQIQVLNSSKYKAQAREQQWSSHKLQARRGDIFSSDNFPIATSKSEYDLFIDTRIVDNQAKLFKALGSQINGLSKTDLKNIIESKEGWVKLDDSITYSQKSELEKQNLKGLIFEEKYKRFYPEKGMLSHVLGVVAQDDNKNEVGYYGLEQYYDGYLRGQEGYLFEERSASGDPILFGGINKIEPKNGADLYLSIDRNIQFICEENLRRGVKKYAARSGTVIVVEPSTGRILAMANFPNYDPSDLDVDEENKDLLRNNAISAIYEPGSVMKALTMSAAIDMKKITPETVYYDDGPKVFSGHKVDNWDGKHHQNETMIEVLQHSNNLGAAWVGLRIGDKALLSYYDAYNLGMRLGIDLDGEERGIIYKDLPLKDIEIANASFGQGISLTPLQVVMIFSAISNDGFLMKPHVVDKIIQNNSEEIIIENEVLSRPISLKSSKTMISMLEKAVSGGEAKFFVLKNYNISGKTGTAQVPIKGGYDEYLTNATFVGFFTNYKNFVMLVKLEEPKFPSGYSAETAVPLWMDIAKLLANYYGLAPDKQVEN